jgi:uncharacterized protein YkwD
LNRPASRSGRHRDGTPTPPEGLVRRLAPQTYSARLGLSITALVGAFGAGVSLLPASFTGSGIIAETPAAAIAALAPGAGGGAPGAAPPSPSAAPPPASPSVSATPSAKAKPKATPATSKASPKPTKTTAKAATGLTAQENEVIRLVNVERGKAGCGSVALNTKLRTAMRLHVQELGTHGNLYISHVSDDGRSFTERAAEQGYTAAGGENVARGQRDAAAVMDSWMNSEGHRANILNCSFKAIGVGAVKGVDGTIVWGQIFGRV